MSEKLASRLEAFIYHHPSESVQVKMHNLRIAFQQLVTELDVTMPECREKSLAVTALEESAMWAMKALSLTDPERREEVYEQPSTVRPPLCGGLQPLST